MLQELIACRARISQLNFRFACQPDNLQPERKSDRIGRLPKSGTPIRKLVPGVFTPVLSLNEPLDLGHPFRGTHKKMTENDEQRLQTTYID